MKRERTNVPTKAEYIEAGNKAWEDVVFYSDGLKVTADLYIPADIAPNQKRPAVVFLSGYSGMKDVYGMDTPNRLWEEGYVVLAFDYRGYGDSEGQRGRHRPLEQAQNTYDAITYLETVDVVDRDRIGIYGTSFGGANAVWAAAWDERARVVVSNVMVSDGYQWMKVLRTPWEFSSWSAQISEAARRRVTTGVVEHMPYMEMVPHDPKYKGVIESFHQSDPRFAYELDHESGEALLRYRPEKVAHLISPRPVLIIYAGNDEICPDEGLRCYEALGEPKKLVVLAGAQHQEQYKYTNPELYEVGMRHTLEWFSEHL
jgi:uncharacterized protein